MLRTRRLSAPIPPDVLPGCVATSKEPPGGSGQGVSVGRVFADASGGVSGVIYGPLPNKSNSRKIVLFGKRPALIKSAPARKYEADFLQVAGLSGLALPALPEKVKLRLTVVVYQENMRRDLDCELLPDLLQKSGIIRNDRAIFKKEYERRIDKERPRVEFTISVWREAEHGVTDTR